MKQENGLKARINKKKSKQVKEMNKKSMSKKIEGHVKSFCEKHNVKDKAIQGVIVGGAIIGTLFLAKGAKKIIKNAKHLLNDDTDY